MITRQLPPCPPARSVGTNTPKALSGFWHPPGAPNKFYVCPPRVCISEDDCGDDCDVDDGADSRRLSRRRLEQLLAPPPPPAANRSLTTFRCRRGHTGPLVRERETQVSGWRVRAGCVCRKCA